VYWGGNSGAVVGCQLQQLGLQFQLVVHAVGLGFLLLVQGWFSHGIVSWLRHSFYDQQVVPAAAASSRLLPLTSTLYLHMVLLLGGGGWKAVGKI
jgi:hypothetical protein